MSEIDLSRLEARLNCITGEHPSAADLTWLSHTAVAFTGQLEQLWLDLPDELRQAFIRRLTDQEVFRSEVDLFPFLVCAAQDPNEEVRAWAIDALVDNLTAPAFQVLLDLLTRAPDPKIRSSVALGVGALCQRAVAGQLDAEQTHALRAVLLTAFKMDDAEVRQRALESVAYFSPDTEVEAAIANAYTTGNRDLTIAALFAMGCNRAPRWFPILYEELQSPDPAIRNVAADAIGEYADERAVERLLPLVEDEDRQVQGRAVSALGDIGGDAAVAVLERIAASDDLWLSQSARLQLEQLRTRR